MTRRKKRTLKIFKMRYNLDKTVCFKCGEITENIEFHHMDSKTKCYNPSASKNFHQFYTETEKCIPLCKGCHLRIHSLNGGTKNPISKKDTLAWLNDSSVW